MSDFDMLIAEFEEFINKNYPAIEILDIDAFENKFIILAYCEHGAQKVEFVLNGHKKFNKTLEDKPYELEMGGCNFYPTKGVPEEFEVEYRIKEKETLTLDEDSDLKVCPYCKNGIESREGKIFIKHEYLDEPVKCDWCGEETDEIYSVEKLKTAKDSIDFTITEGAPATYWDPADSDDYDLTELSSDVSGTDLTKYDVCYYDEDGKFYTPLEAFDQLVVYEVPHNKLPDAIKKDPSYSANKHYWSILSEKDLETADDPELYIYAREDFDTKHFLAGANEELLEDDFNRFIPDEVDSLIKYIDRFENGIDFNSHIYHPGEDY